MGCGRSGSKENPAAGRGQEQARGAAGGIEVEPTPGHVVEVIDPVKDAMMIDAVGAEVLAVDVGAKADLGVAKGRVFGPRVETAGEPVGREEMERAAVEEERALRQQRDLSAENLRVAASEAAVIPEDRLYRVAHVRARSPAAIACSCSRPCRC